jgi:hypothetical protein
MMKDPNHPNEEPQASRPSGQERQEQYQRTRQHAASGQNEQDREARIRKRAHDIWEQEGQPEGLAEEHWKRAAQDLDQEEAGMRREGAAGEKPAGRPQEDARLIRDKN